MSGKLLVKQVEKFQQNRMEIARAIVKGIGVNIYEVLYHYYKDQLCLLRGIMIKNNMRCI